MSLLLLHPLPGSAYQVRSGDSLWTIGRRYGVSVSSLEAANGLSDSSVLHIGQHLTIPGRAAAPPAYRGTTRSYTVRPGDSLWTLAQEFGTSVDTLQSLNQLTTDNLQIGQILRVPGSPPAPPRTTSAPTEVSRGIGPFGRLVAYAEKFQGAPYHLGGSTPSAFDCSGFVRYVYHAFGIDLPRTTWEQHEIGKPVAENQLRPGDLVFFNTVGYLAHDGIYVGNGRFISATCSRGVAVERLDDAYWSRTYAGARQP